METICPSRACASRPAPGLGPRAVAGLALLAAGLLACQGAPPPRAPVRELKKTDPAYNFAGRWYSTFGYLDLTQEGRKVQGTYSCCQGAIRGTVQGNRIEFFWHDPVYGEGWGYFFIRDNGYRLDGGWAGKDGMSFEGSWSAVRLDDPEPPGTPSRWRLSGEHPRFGEIEGSAVLYVAEDRVLGELSGVCHLESQGKPFRQEVFHYLDGSREAEGLALQWEDPVNFSWGPLDLSWEGEDLLRGTWRDHEGERDHPVLLTRLPDPS